ncbi:tryptophan-rich sensory protein [Staphylococcus sp. NAM3COL9]|uniref:tryptophan-rich sensory protein n=1 Tax=Staphylococcus sp. NAM3COL9 TaxID=1667172 RepID=UPI0034638490
MVFQASYFSITNYEEKYEKLLKPKKMMDSLFLPIIWLIINVISAFPLSFLQLHKNKKFFLGYNGQLITQSLWYVTFFKYQSLLSALLLKIFQSIFIVLSIKSIAKSKKVFRFCLRLHLIWSIYEIYTNASFCLLNKKSN